MTVIGTEDLSIWLWLLLKKKTVIIWQICPPKNLIQVKWRIDYEYINEITVVTLHSWQQRTPGELQWSTYVSVPAVVQYTLVVIFSCSLNNYDSESSGCLGLSGTFWLVDICFPGSFGRNWPKRILMTQRPIICLLGSWDGVPDSISSLDFPLLPHFTIPSLLISFPQPHSHQL